ncbi:MAG: histidyl-tRNA synthetase [Actinomycetota bacterium]|jgi:histidyl-tRNA synthetase|nr:histidyl-tRNA synthetase [Actinomycetota bacterium]
MTEEPGGLRAPRGTRDILPPESWAWLEVVGLALQTFAEAGYAPIETPIFEHTEVFQRGVGEASEVVNKQMYTFTDRGDRSLTLRPEGTAPVMRAVLEHGLHKGPLPVKVAYAGPMFRQERPQKGRYRQFFQVGLEAIGSDDPLVDAEAIEVGQRFFAAAGVDARLKLNSIGHVDTSCRLGYMKVLVEFLEAHESDLAPEDRERITTNPLRTFDSKEPQTIEVMKEAPLLVDRLCPACREHFEAVQGLLKEVGVDFDLDPRLVRGLDYYTRTAFEWVSTGLGSQDSVGGGGRYDGLSEALGGPPLPSIGIAPGIDRIMLAREAPVAKGAVRVYVVSIGPEARSGAFSLATRLRRAGIGTDLDLVGRSMKGQMKDASRSGARYALIIGASELASGVASLKDLDTGDQREVPLDDLERAVSKK